MAYVAMDKNGEEWVYQVKPTWDSSINAWVQTTEWTDVCLLPNGSIKKLTGVNLSWDAEPIEL